MSKRVLFKVPGIALPQGSMRPGVTKTGKPFMHSDNPNLQEWRIRVAWVAQMQRRGVFFERREAVTVGLGFFFVRPKSLPKGVAHHVTRPDIDKLERAVFDALTGVLWHDDSQVVAVTKRKGFAPDGAACVVISVSGVD